MGYYDEDGIMMGAVQLDDSQFEMGAPRRRQGRHPTMILPVAFPIFTIVAATGISNVRQTLQPSVPYAVAQMFATVNRNGTSAASPIAFLNNLQVGPTPVILNGGTNLDRYSAGAFHNNFRLPPTGIGQTYVGDVGLSVAVTGSDSVTAYIEFHGQAKLSPGFVLHNR